MFDGILKVVDRLTNRKISISKRLGNLILIVFALLAVDFVFQITHSLYQSNKLSNLEKVIVLKEAYKNDPQQLKYVTNLEQDLLKKDHYYYYMESAWRLSRETFQETQYRNGETDLSYFWAIFSSTFLFWAFLIYGITTTIAQGDFSMNKLRVTAAIILVMLIIICILIFISSIIPVIFKPFLTYIALFLIQIGIIILIIKYTDYKEAQRTKKRQNSLIRKGIVKK